MGPENGEIMVVPFFGQGHLFPSIELCKHLASRSLKTTLVVSPNLSCLPHHPLITIVEMDPPAHRPPPPPSMVPGSNHHDAMSQGLRDLLAARDPTDLPVCAVVDIMMSWSRQVFASFGVPAVSFFTTGACSLAMEYAAWKSQLPDLKPGEFHSLPGLPGEMTLSYSDLEHHPPPPPPPPPPRPSHDNHLGPFRPPHAGPPMHHPKLGEAPIWIADLQGSLGLLINTCHELEHPFIEYIADRIQKPVWGVGPLLPDPYWTSSGSLFRDRTTRPARESNYTEDDVIEWLGSKPRGSVLYVSFGSEVSPSGEELSQLADALESWSGPFVWAVQSGSGRPGPPRFHAGPQPDSEVEDQGYYPHGLDERVGPRGMIIRGWAPQLLILSHPSTAGFLSHCGWNSTVEAIGRGVPLLAWPVRGDQPYNAKLVVRHLKVGHMVSYDTDPSKKMVLKKEDIERAIEKLMTDDDVKRRATALRTTFEEHGFPASSNTSSDAFRDFLINLKAPQ